MIRTFGATYGTIDIRSAAVRLVNGWLNAYAVVRLTYEEPEVGAERLRKLETDQGTVHTDLFRILLGVRPFSEWGDFCEELAHSRMHIGDEEVQLNQPLTLMPQRTQLGTNYFEIRPFDSWTWPVAHYSFFPHNSSPLMYDALTREAGRLGFSDADEAANLLCGINIRPGQANGYQFWLSTPMFAMIQNVRASLLRSDRWKLQSQNIAVCHH